jgi:hexosaminidase
VEELVLLPAPRQVAPGAGQYVLRENKLIFLYGTEPAALQFSAKRLQSALRRHASVDWEIVASAATPPEMLGLTLRVAVDQELKALGPGAYRLSIRSGGITVQAATEAGIFYGVCTLVQIIQQAGGRAGRALPCLEILDWPDYPARGVMLDVSRDKVPAMHTLYRLVDMLAGWKINQLQLYTEHTFAYRRHPAVWATASPLTGQEILDLDAYCRERYIELVPNQNSFGHMERWLKHPAYEQLAEIVGEIKTPWGHFRGPFSLCAVDEGSLQLLRSLYDELLPHFNSRLFNVGCDETWDLGQGRSHAACQAVGGAGKVYLDFLLKIQAEVQAREHTMQFWADILIQHPELISAELQHSIALEWGYEAGHPWAEHTAQLAGAGVPFYVCPGTSSWCSLAGRTDNALTNLRQAATYGLVNDAIGFLNTDWGDAGHWQALPVSYLGLAAGAAYSWALDANQDVDMAEALNRHAFHDATGRLGRAAYDLGNVYQALSYRPHNGSALFHILQKSAAQVLADPRLGRLTPEDFASAEVALDRAAASLVLACPESSDAELLTREFWLTERLLRHACRRGRLIVTEDLPHAGQQRRQLAQDMQEIQVLYRAAWLDRNRPGGLADSLGRLERAQADYCVEPGLVNRNSLEHAAA